MEGWAPKTIRLVHKAGCLILMNHNTVDRVGSKVPTVNKIHRVKAWVGVGTSGRHWIRQEIVAQVLTFVLLIFLIVYTVRLRIFYYYCLFYFNHGAWTYLGIGIPISALLASGARRIDIFLSKKRRWSLTYSVKSIFINHKRFMLYGFFNKNTQI